MYVFVYKEFIGLEKLKMFTNKIRVCNEFVKRIEGDAPDEVFEKNIKIFFENEKEEAYKLKEEFESNNIATFVTDQLTVTRKDKNEKAYTVCLPKDRIIMKLI